MEGRRQAYDNVSICVFRLSDRQLTNDGGLEYRVLEPYFLTGFRAPRTTLSAPNVFVMRFVLSERLLEK